MNQKNRDSKTYLRFGTSAYCQRQLDRLSIKQIFFHYRCVRIPETQENHHAEICFLLFFIRKGSGKLLLHII